MLSIDYSKYKGLKVEKDNGIAKITFLRSEHFNAFDKDLHQAMSEIWLDIEKDRDVKVTIVTGSGKAFSAGGDFSMINRMIHDVDFRAEVHEETRNIVNNMINTTKPIISAINGIAVGAGCVIALLSDISIASESASFGDGHVRLGVAAGDHAAVIWPLLCGMAKAKHYLLTGEFLSAREAERIGLISMVVKHEELMEKVMNVANAIIRGPQRAIQYTKRSMNQWLRHSFVISYDLSCALEMINFGEDDVKEGVLALQQRRPAKFPSAKL